MKRGSANMWWIIIGAVIALVVMIILMVMFTGKTGTLETGLLDCASKGGYCIPETDCTSRGGTISNAFQCTGTEECCFLSGAKKGPDEHCQSDADCLSGSCAGLEQYVGGFGTCT